MNKDIQQQLKNIGNFNNYLSKSTLHKYRNEIKTDIYGDDILPFDLYRGKRNNITIIGDQINKAFAFDIYDGCAILMRRLIEMLLILTFKENGNDLEIKNKDGNYYDLSEIIRIAKNSKKISFSRNAKEYFELFREKGNLSAHNPFHNARRKDIEVLQPKFRHLIEELLYTSKILK